MRRFVVIGIMLAFLCSVHGQKRRFGQPPTSPIGPPIRVHISASHIRHNCSAGTQGIACGYGLYVDAVLNGNKVELWGNSKIGKQQLALLAPGDYTAELTNDEDNADQTVISRRYSLLLPDGTTWACQLSAIME